MKLFKRILAVFLLYNLISIPFLMCVDLSISQAYLQAFLALLLIGVAGFLFILIMLLLD